jgi:DNA polymerase
LERIRDELGDCCRCRLSESRSNIVFGVGDSGARLLFVGEAPGADEDRKGEPFVGRAGQLLDRMIQALGMEREAVYIANVLKCRPPNNRDPRPDEVETCSPFLWRQIDAIRPTVICALGAHAARSLLGTETAIGSLRGRLQKARGWTVVPTYHPAYLLRSPQAKRLAWADLKTVKRLLEGGT